MPNLSLKFLEGVMEKLKEENVDLQKEVDFLKEEIGSLRGELQALPMIVSDNTGQQNLGFVIVQKADYPFLW